MKNALTMFNELGFKLYNSGENFLLYKFETDYDQVFIRFDLGLKTYNAEWYMFVDNNELTFVPMNERPQNIKHSAKYGHWQRKMTYDINIKLHTAIHRQMTEFGWVK